MGKTIVITGGSDGIGKAAAQKLAAQDNEVIIVGRNPEKTRAVAREIGIPCYIADFAKLDDVRELALQLASLPQIDVLANNAGGVRGKRELTVDGFESTFQINHLAPFLLTNLLLPRLIADKASVINTASAANTGGHINIDDLNSEHGYQNFKVYGTTKLENILFTTELNHRYFQDGIRTAAFHPGVIASNFGSEAGGLINTLYHTPLRRILRFKTVEQGAEPLVWLASTESGKKDWHSGNYYNDKHEPGKLNPQGHDLDLAQKLWETSARMVGLKDNA